MRLVSYTNGSYSSTLLCLQQLDLPIDPLSAAGSQDTKITLKSGLSGKQTYTSSEIEQLLEQYIDEEDKIENLSIDFCGVFVPVTHRSEVRLVARLVSVYHNSVIETSEQVSEYKM